MYFIFLSPTNADWRSGTQCLNARAEYYRDYMQLYRTFHKRYSDLVTEFKRRNNLLAKRYFENKAKYCSEPANYREEQRHRPRNKIIESVEHDQRYIETSHHLSRHHNHQADTVEQSGSWNVDFKKRIRDITERKVKNRERKSSQQQEPEKSKSIENGPEATTAKVEVVKNNNTKENKDESKKERNSFFNFDLDSFEKKVAIDFNSASIEKECGPRGCSSVNIEFDDDTDDDNEPTMTGFTFIPQKHTNKF